MCSVHFSTFMTILSHFCFIPGAIYLYVYGPDGIAEWSRRETSEPGVLGSNPPQVSDCPTILPGLGGYPDHSL